jgi:hypothetical protein
MDSMRQGGRFEEVIVSLIRDLIEFDLMDKFVLFTSANVTGSAGVVRLAQRHNDVLRVGN